MPWTLWRYIFIEVGRLVLLSTAVLVTVIAFAATVKPLADGKLTALDALRFMFYAIPPMLAYALPFAAGFGATLAYHRMAQDNEVTASFAGGLGHWRVLAPALAMGAALGMGLGLLNDQIIPRFLTRMERIVTNDIAQVMIRSLEQGESAKFGNVQIHADAVTRMPASDRDPRFQDQIRLVGVIALELDDDGSIAAECTATEAYVLMFRAEHLSEEDRGDIRPGDTVVQIYFPEAFLLLPGTGQVYNQHEFTTPPVPLPSAFQDDPKFLTGGALRALRENPERMNWIDGRRLELARKLAGERTIRSMREDVRSLGSVKFVTPNRAEYNLRTSGLEWDRPSQRWRVEPPLGSDRVELEIYADGSIDRYFARHAWLSADRGGERDIFAKSAEGSLTFKLGMEEVEVRSSADAGTRSIPTERPRWSFEGLVAEDDRYPRLRRMSSAELLAEASGSEQNAVRIPAENLSRDIAKLGREITSKQHERLAMNASCLVMVFTGAVMALRLRQALPLVVYLWSFFPALGTIIFISSGQQTTHRQGWVGLPILWFGVIGLAAFAGWMFVRLRRH